MATELGGNQISSLMETLPGIANVLRSPVADALVNAIRAAARLREFQLADAKELISYATRRGLLGNDEGDRVLAEVTAADQKRQERLAARGVVPAPPPPTRPVTPVVPKPSGKPAPLTIGPARPRPPVAVKPVVKPVAPKAVAKHPPVAAAKKPQAKPVQAHKKPVKAVAKKAGKPGKRHK